MISVSLGERHPAAKATIARWSELRTDRARFEADWEDIGWLIQPTSGGFGLSDAQERDRKKALSSEPIMAAASMKAGIYSALTNPATEWSRLEPMDPDLASWGPMADWIDLANRRVMASFRPDVSSFYSSSLQMYGNIVSFGTGIGYDQLDPTERRFLDVSLNLAECCVTVDGHGRVTELVRMWRMTPANAVRFFGKAAENLPGKVRELAEKGKNDRIAFYWHVGRNDDFRKGAIGPRGKRWFSRWICEEAETLVRDGGFDEMPFYAPRWDVLTGDCYGIGAGHYALPASRVLQNLEATSMRGKQMAVDQPLLAPSKDDWPLNGRVRPGSVIYGGMNIRGQPMVQPLQTGQGLQLSDAERLAKKEEIAKCFHYALMPLMGRTGLNPEEVRIIEEANLRAWAPNADRIMEEYAAQKVMRRFRMLVKAGQIPPAPEGTPKDAEMAVSYTSAATMAQRARVAGQVRGYVADAAGIAQLSPDHARRVAARLDPDELLEALHHASPGLPARLLRGREEADVAAEQAAQAEQAMAAMQTLQAGGAAARDFGQAAQSMGMGEQ